MNHQSEVSQTTENGPCSKLYVVSFLQRSLNLADEAFVTRKITQGIARIAHGAAEVIELGHLDSTRDWTHAKDMVRGIHLMMSQETPQDLVLASGQSRSVRHFVEVAFAVIGVEIQ